MISLSQLEEQINNLNALNKASSKDLDAFADTSNAIATRARQITRDVQPWEVAQENIALTIEEMSKAARCYHPPPVLPAVLAKREKSPEAVARCVDYLVYTDDYLSSHPPNEYGDAIQAKVFAQLRAIVGISEDLVKTAFINAFQRNRVGNNFGGVSRAAASQRLIKNPEALSGIEQVIHRLGENFNRMDAMQNDVRSLLEGKLKGAVEAQFDGTYREEESGRSQLTTHSSMAPVMKHYQRGSHRLLGISRLARGYVMEVAEVVKQHILTPLDDDYAVAEMPGDLATPVFDIIASRAATVVSFDVSAFQDPTKLFVLSRGQGIGLYPGKAYFRDTIFVGLDLIEEFWNWKSLAAALPGDNNTFIDYVDNQIEQFIFTVRTLLDGYVTSKGCLQKNLLKEYTLSLHRTEWFPSIDCTAHESTTNLLYFHKVLLSTYYGATKLALYGNTLDPNADVEAVKEVEDYLIRCVLGTIQDLEVIAQTAVALQEEAEARGQRRVKQDSMHLISGGGGARLSVEIFLLNNIMFLHENYKREPCFSERQMAVEGQSSPAAPKPTRPTPKSALASATANPITAVSFSTNSPRAAATASATASTTAAGEGRQRKKKQPAKQPIVAHILLILDDEKGRSVDDFGVSWEKCFPKEADNPVLGTIVGDANQPLSKSQRMAVKQWHKSVTIALNAKIRDCRCEAVMSTETRAQLIDVSIVSVQEQFKLFQGVLRGREWSKRPQKWMPYTPDEWVEQIRRVF